MEYKYLKDHRTFSNTHLFGGCTLTFYRNCLYKVRSVYYFSLYAWGPIHFYFSFLPVCCSWNCGYHSLLTFVNVLGVSISWFGCTGISVSASLLLRQASHKICRLLVKFFCQKNIEKYEELWPNWQKLEGKIERKKKQKKKTVKATPQKIRETFSAKSADKNRHVLKTWAPRPGCCSSPPATGLEAPRKRNRLSADWETTPCCSASTSQPGEWERAGLLLSSLWLLFFILALPCLQDSLTSPAHLLSPCIAGDLCSASDLITCFLFRKLHCSRLMESPEVFVFPGHTGSPTEAKKSSL